MPEWLNCALAKVVVMPAAGTRPAGAPDTWQVSHDAVLGTWAGCRSLIARGLTP
jgi:hypothetical protein